MSRLPHMSVILWKAFIFETTITAQSRIPPNRILRTVLSQSAFIPRLREGGDDKEQRMWGDRGGRMMKKSGGKTKRAAAAAISSALNRPRQNRRAKRFLCLCLLAFQWITIFTSRCSNSVPLHTQITAPTWPYFIGLHLLLLLPTMAAHESPLSLLSNFLWMGPWTISCFHLLYLFDLWPSRRLGWV